MVSQNQLPAIAFKQVFNNWITAKLSSKVQTQIAPRILFMQTKSSITDIKEESNKENT